MKLFGKRKIPSAAAADEALKPVEPKEEVVSSYFSTPDKEDNSSGKNKEHEIEELLAMEFSELNAKQRRILKRHTKRTSVGSKEDKKLEKQPSKEKSSKVDDSIQEKEAADIEEEVRVKEDEDEGNNPLENDSCSPVKTEEPKEAKLSVEEIAAQLQGVNSKDRRKMLRKLASDYDEEFLAKATEASKKVAGENESKQEAANAGSSSSVQDETSKGQDKSVEDVANQLKGLNSKERRKLLRQLSSQYDEAFLENVTEASKKIAEVNEAKQVQEQKTAEKESGKRKAEDIAGSVVQQPNKKKGKKMKDLSHLPADERARREIQRKMQQEAAVRRAAGEVHTRHPLNSERRRANKRKPGRAGKIAIMKKQFKEKQQAVNDFNAGGYTMRHLKKEGM